MAIIIYKYTSHIDWESSGIGVTYPSSGGLTPISVVGLNGTGVAGQVAVFSSNQVLEGFDGFTYEEDSAGVGTLKVILPEKTSETDVVYYDSITGLFSYGEGGGDALWMLDENGYTIPVNDDGVLIYSIVINNANSIYSVFGNISLISAPYYQVLIGYDGDTGTVIESPYFFVKSDLVYFGDGVSSGTLPAKTSETNVVYYDPATGKLSYGTP